jgi:hypothetical protein
MAEQPQPDTKADSKITDTTIIDLYGAYRQYLDHEHNLINHRLSWNFTIQDFLFTSYAFVLNNSESARVYCGSS